MIAQERNSQQVEILKADFQHLSDPSFAWGSIASMFLSLPALRGFWPMSAVNGSGNAIDLSGNGLTLTNNNAVYDSYLMAPIADLRAASSYLSVADTAALDIQGTEAYIATPGLTLGGWYRHNGAISATAGMISKVTTPANASYVLDVTGAGVARLLLSSNGAAFQGAGLSTGSLAADTWHFVVGKYDPAAASGERIIVWLDGVIRRLGTFSSAIFGGSSSLFVGADGGSPAYSIWDGDLSLQFICASAVPDYIITALYHRSRRLFGV